MRKLLLGTAMLALAGCATITNEKNVPIELSIKDDKVGECTLSNKYGSWTVTTPNRVFVRRSRDNLAYRCDLSDGSQLTGIIPTGPSGKIAGNLVFGGIIGTAIDVSTEKASSYPVAFIIGVSSEKPIDQDGN